MFLEYSYYILGVPCLAVSLESLYKPQEIATHPQDLIENKRPRLLSKGVNSYALTNQLGMNDLLCFLGFARAYRLTGLQQGTVTMNLTGIESERDLLHSPAEIFHFLVHSQNPQSSSFRLLFHSLHPNPSTLQ